MSFSYLSDTDMFPVNAGTGQISTIQDNTINPYYINSNNPTTGFPDINETSNQFLTNVLTGADFYSQVWNKTLGGALPFIFQPDSDNENPDQFCIAKFDMKSLEISQVAFKSYEISLKIKEVW